MSETETNSPGLTIQDLQLTLQLIQAGSVRGAWRAEEFTIIGNLHDRLFKFLQDAGNLPVQPNTPASAPGVPKDNQSLTSHS